VKIRSITCGLTVLLLSTTCLNSLAAGFVDERTKPKPYPAPAAAATATALPAPVASAPVVAVPVVPVLKTLQQEWDELAPQAPAGGVSLALALVTLVPSQVGPLQIDAPRELLDRKVSWASGLSRQASVANISEKNDVSIAFQGPKVEVKMLPSAKAVRAWAVRPTDTRLATTLERWTKAAGMKLVWDARQHVIISSEDNFEGTFEEGLARVLLSPGIRQSSYPLEACIYPNVPPVVRITRFGDQADQCPK
jgi:hypothetical protein